MSITYLQAIAQLPNNRGQSTDSSKSKPMRIIIFLLLLGYNVCMAAEWEDEVNSKLDGLISQLNDGCSDEVKEARTLYRFKKGESYLYAALISIEGQHCGNGNIEYLAVYDVGFERVTDEEKESQATYWLVGLAIVGGRGERLVDFKSLKFANGVFSMAAKTYKNDAMCCPSHPVKLKYKLSFYGLSAVQSNPALKLAPSARPLAAR